MYSQLSAVIMVLMVTMTRVTTMMMMADPAISGRFY